MRVVRIFYSWQSDDCETSDFIEGVLKDVVRDLCAEFGSELKVMLDKDTHGETGSPDITSVILDKIDRADIIVSDVSYVGEYADRKIVNQNVMFETGYAIAKHSTNSVIMLFNKDKGRVKDLPFDIAHNRVTSFATGDSREKLRLEIYCMLKSMFGNCFIMNTDYRTVKLDMVQIEIMKIFASIQKEKLLILSDLGIFGGLRVWSCHKYDKQRKIAMVNEIGAQKLIANLNDLVNRGILRKRADGRSVVFEPTKVGFSIIENIDRY